MRDVLIVGGGITGLVSAYLAAKSGRKVTVIEASAQFGGLLNTFEVGGNRLEFYYHHFFTHDAEMRWLLRELGLSDKLKFYSSSMGIYRHGEIYPFNNLFDLLKFSPLNFFEKLRFGLSSIYLGNFADWRKYESVSSYDWLKRWAGEGVTNNIWAPMLNVKFGEYKNEVPASWMVGRLRQRMRSRKRGDEKLGYLEGSLQVLLDAICERLSEMGVRLVNNAPVIDIKINDNKVVEIVTGPEVLRPDDVLFTIPGSNLSELLRNHCAPLSENLARVKYFGAACTILELDRSLSDVYWLNIAEDGFPFGGVIEHTNLVSPTKYNGRHIVYLSRYFAKEEAIAIMTDEEIKTLMISYLSKVFRDFSTSWIQNVSVFRTNTAATVCDKNFSRKVPLCRSEFSNMFIANMAHIYPDERSVNNSIRIAAEACRVMGIDTSYVPRHSSLSGQIGF